MKILFLIVTVIFIHVICASTISDATVEYYVDLINNHTEKALEYEFPSDASSYVAENTSVVGKRFFQPSSYTKSFKNYFCFLYLYNGEMYTKISS